MKADRENIIAKGHFDTRDGHSLYYELWGANDGENVIFLHGGPGYGFSEQDRRFFDPERHKVLFFEQRGTGRSRPYASLKNNTTSDHLSDIELLIGHFNLKSPTLFGGSWGSTLAVLFAKAHLRIVRRLVLRGFFPANKSCIDHYVSPEAGSHVPEAYERFISHVPASERKEVARYYRDKMLSQDTDMASRFAFEWDRYGAHLATTTPDTSQIEEHLRSNDHFAHALFVAHYSVNYCFMADADIYDDIDTLDDIEIQLVHGDEDLLCPVEYATRLASLLPHTELKIVDAGHASSEPAIERVLIDWMSAQRVDRSS